MAAAFLAPGPALAQGAGGLEQALAEARGAARIPLLLDLCERRGDDPGAMLDLSVEVLGLIEEFPSDEHAVRVHDLRAWAYQAQGDYHSAQTEAQRALAFARREGRPDLMADATYHLALVHWRKSELGQALKEAEQARALQVQAGPSAELELTLTLIGGIHQRRSNLDSALEAYLAALALSETLGDERASARAHNNIGIVYWQQGRHEQAHKALLRALEITERLGPKMNLSGIASNLGRVLTELDRPHEALPYLERAQSLNEERGDLLGQAKGLGNLAFAYEKLGDPARALATYRESLALRERIEDKDGIVHCRAAIGELLRQQGEYEEAIRVLEGALPLADEIGTRQTTLDILRSLSEARAAVGDFEGALSDHRRLHALDAELNDAAARESIAELQLQYETAARESELASVEELAASRQERLETLAVGSGLLGGCLVLLGVLYALRVRAQRAVAESEQRYRTSFQASLVPTFLIDADARTVIDHNVPAAELSSALAAAGPAAVEALEPEWVRSALQRALEPADSGPLELADCWVEGSDRPRWIEVRAWPVSLSGRECRLVTVRDTTQVHAQEEERMREERLLALGVLAGGIAHDFNNALTGITGHIELAREGDAADRERMLEFAEQAAVGARRLTAQLLAFAKGGEPVRRNEDVGRLLRDAVALATSGSHVRVEVDVPRDLWWARLDGGQFDQVVSNLLINAQQATGEGGRLVVRASNVEDDPAAPGAGRFVRIDVEDDGVGIPEEVRGRVFDPYFTTKAGGSGLGLATAFKICSNHGGTLTFDSREGLGTTFHAFFPAAGTEGEEPEPSAVRDPVGTGRVLVLEDETLVRNVLRKMLEQWGFTVEAVTDGRTAVERYAAGRATDQPFVFAIMDLTIPGGMGGRRALQEILALDPSARAIVASGYSDDPTMAHYREAGFLAALPKPFRRSDLARAVQAVLAVGR